MMAFVYTHKEDNLLEFVTKDWRFGLLFDDKESGWYFVSKSLDAQYGYLSEDIINFLHNATNRGE